MEQPRMTQICTTCAKNSDESIFVSDEFYEGILNNTPEQGTFVSASVTNKVVTEVTRTDGREARPSKRPVGRRHHRHP